MQSAATSPRCARKSLASSCVKRNGSALENTSTPSSGSLRRSGISARLPGLALPGSSSSWSALWKGPSQGRSRLTSCGATVVSASTKLTPCSSAGARSSPAIRCRISCCGSCTSFQLDEVGLIGRAQADDEALEELRERSGSQQCELALLGLAKQRVGAAHL